MSFVARSIPPADRDEPRVVEPLPGYKFVMDQIDAAIADAKGWADQMRAAMMDGNAPAMQRAAEGVHIRCQTAQVVARMTEKDIAAHRQRRPHE